MFSRLGESEQQKPELVLKGLGLIYRRNHREACDSGRSNKGAKGREGR